MAFLFLFFTVALSLCVVGLIVNRVRRNAWKPARLLGIEKTQNTAPGGLLITAVPARWADRRRVIGVAPVSVTTSGSGATGWPWPMLPQQPAFCGNQLGSSIVPFHGTGAAIEHRPWDLIVGRWRTSGADEIREEHRWRVLGE
jgi:hypothetical protein